MLEVTTIGSHSHAVLRIDSQAPAKARHRLANAFLWQFFLGGLQGSFQLISRFRLG